ncbi:uncharacterized protein LOC129957303 [Argiope bruennichi]|uniref:uncharacterized protein LOC129957303 n=1 Tax=Argiope bruennichi TaxID=94029 RepID=UPI002495582A|nr:uncharacterized protein LOC129957303 [Argiope bruennichi]XP_055925544.1 uncharacterized protein LOC129957303 [Argiope bruennichi]XP_055925545.1 uncharacterized protein LOC129957303 [Argiope bruennichi]
MDSPQEGGVDISGRTRKFGLPNWMVNNIERLNFATDFEEYASSPPETEGFLSEYMENHDKMETYSDSSHSISEHNNVYENSKTTSENMPSSNLIMNALNERVSPQCHSLLTNFKHEDLYSSPDSTPCATPEPSPVIRRKLSIPQPNDTIQTNPGRWFYMGKFKKPDKQSILANCNKENQSNTQQERDAVKDQDKFAKPSKPAIQLVISNFDLNAVSPTSW